MSGPRSRHPHDDEGLLQPDRLDLGIPLDEVGQRQPVPQQANHSLPQGRASELGQAFVGFDRGHVRGQAVTEAVGVVQVVTHTCLVDGFDKHPIDVEFDGLGLGELQNLTLDIGQLRRRQIVEVDVAHRRTHATSSTFALSNISTAARGGTLQREPACFSSRQKGCPVLVVTTNDIPGWEIKRVCGEVFGLTVRSRNAFSQFGAGFKSMFGGELQGMTKNLAESRNEAMTRLTNEARNKGGNAIVAMRFDTTEIGDVWTEICAYGTAVQAVPVTDAARYTASQLGYGGAQQPQPQPHPQQR